MNRERLQPILVILVLVGVLTYLFRQTLAADPNRHNQIVNTIQQLIYQDSLLIQSVLMARAGSLSHYDPLSDERHRVFDLIGKLKDPSLALYHQSESATDIAIDDTESLVHRKLQLIERFKSHNAILRNSLLYLPLAVERRKLDSPDARLHDDLDELLRTVLLYHATPTERVREQALDLIRKLQIARKRDAELLRHAENIVSKRQSLLVLVDELLELPTRQSIEKIYAAHNSNYERKLQQAGIYRSLMYFMAMLLLAYVLLLLFKLRTAMRNLKNSLSEVEFQKYAIDQHAIVAITDRKGVINYVNDKFCEITQYTRAEVIGQTHRIINSGYHPREFFKQMWATIGRGNVWHGDIKNRRKDGSNYWVDTTIVPYLDESGKPERYVSIRADITERKRAEDELRIAATAFDSQEGIMITDANSVILRVNHAFTQITGYSAEEAVGQTPRLFKSDRHNADFYRSMWDTINRTGKWQGEIWDRRKNGEVFPKWLSITAVEGHDGAVTHYIGSHLDITERKASEEKIQHLAFYDPLTNLPNRRLLMDRLQHALASSERSGRTGALLFLDLDNFKNLNDTMGHDVGDLLLRQAALRLVSSVREGDTVARLGGDEFVVMLEVLNEDTLDAPAQVEVVGGKILVALRQPFNLGESEVITTASIGATLFSDNQQPAEELMKQADIAMYHAKKAGRNRLRFFDPKMQVAINERSLLEGELRQAIVMQQFHLHYQVQTDSMRRPLGAEGLIRWTHPERGIVPPMQFIPLAEEIGLIIPIGQWVIDTACAQLKIWQHDTQTRDLTLSINVSARQFLQADFVTQVQAAVQRHAIPARLLKLELTESLLQENIEVTIATMHALKVFGVQFSLDDFGTGFSSLQYLKLLPLDQIKIDQSFVRDITSDPSDRAIVQTIISMARSLNLEVIAEGVETEEQRQFLVDNGCERFQGYLFGRPVPYQQFEESLKQG